MNRKCEFFEAFVVVVVVVVVDVADDDDDDEEVLLLFLRRGPRSARRLSRSLSEGENAFKRSVVCLSKVPKQNVFF